MTIILLGEGQMKMKYQIKIFLFVVQVRYYGDLNTDGISEDEDNWILEIFWR